MICYFCRHAILRGYRIEVRLPNITHMYDVYMCEECSDIQMERAGHLIAPIPHYTQVMRADKDVGTPLHFQVTISPYVSPVAQYMERLSEDGK